MNTYKVLFSRDEYGYILVRAETIEQARDVIESGNFDDNDLEYKGGSMVVDDVQLLWVNS